MLAPPTPPPDPGPTGPAVGAPPRVALPASIERSLLALGVLGLIGATPWVGARALPLLAASLWWGLRRVS